MLVWDGIEGGGRRSEVLAVAGLLHDLPDPPIAVQLLEEIRRGDQPGVPPLARRLHLLLERAPEHPPDLRATHAAHRGQHRAVAELVEERAPRLGLRALPHDLED